MIKRLTDCARRSDDRSVGSSQRSFCNSSGQSIGRATTSGNTKTRSMMAVADRKRYIGWISNLGSRLWGNP
jgi:hypothetical protein